MLELTLPAQYITIIKMIKILSCRQIGINGRFFKRQQLLSYSVQKSGVEMEFLKHSKFSHFMGLSTEMKNLSKQQQKNEKREIRQAQFLTILALIGVTSFTVFLYFNHQFTFKIRMILKMINSKSGYSSKQKKQSLLIEIQKYLISNPYQYKTLIHSMLLILSSSPSQDQQEIQQRVEQIYLKILKHNFKAAQNQILKDGLQKLVQRSFFSKRILNKRIIEILLTQGSIRQFYLTAKYLQFMNDNKWILSQDLRIKLANNYQRNKKINQAYFYSIFSKVNEHKLPIFVSFKEIEQQRLSYLQNFLKKIEQ